MSDYTQVVDYSTKDALTSGDPSKKILGSEIDAELAAIATAIASKVDTSDVTPVATGGTGATTAAAARTNLGLGTMATQDASAVAVTGGSVNGITDLAVADGGTGASTAAGARTNLGLGALATANSVSQSTIDAAAVGQSQLKTSQGEVSTTSSDTLLTLPGGEYGLYPQLRVSGGTGTELVGATIGGVNVLTNAAIGTTFISRIVLTGGGGATMRAQQRYVTASPPYESYRANDPVPRFVFCLMEIDTGRIIGGYDADDPPWANNGPTILNPLGRLQALMRSRLGVTPEQVRSSPGLRAQYELELAAMWDFLHDPKSTAAITTELARKFTQAEKNADMSLIPHPFLNFNPATHRVIVLSPTDNRFCRGLAMRQLMGDSVLEALHGGYFDIDNTPMPGLVTPSGVIAVQARWKRTG